MPEIRSLTARRRALIAGAAVYAAAFVVIGQVKPGSDHFFKLLFNLLQALPPVFAGLCSLYLARRRGGGGGAGHEAATARRVGWALVGLGSLGWAAGQFLFAYYEFRSREVPLPGPPDYVFLPAYPLLFVGVVLLFGAMPAVSRTRLLLDAAIAASGVGILCWHFIIQPSLHASDVSLAGKVLSAVYPLYDVAILFGAFVLVGSAWADKRLRRSVGLLAGGLTLVAAADVAFTYLTFLGAYATGTWTDAGWPLGFLLVGFAPLTALWRSAETRPVEEKRSEPVAGKGSASLVLLRLLAPYAIAVTAFGTTAVHDHVGDGGVSDSVVVMGFGIILLVIVRQVLTLVENQRLAGDLRVFNETLEHSVAERTGELNRRTRQIEALQELTRVVNNTLDPEQVIASAAEQAQRALLADAVQVRLSEPNDKGDSGDTTAAGAAPPRLRVHAQRGLEGRPEIAQVFEGLTLRDYVERVPLPASERESACLQAPLRWRQKPIGTISVVRWRGDFDDGDAALLESIGIEAGTALENARSYERALEAADNDSVTGLFNHRAIHQRLDTQLRRAGEQEKPVAVIMMDLNNFKLFNDTYGHPVGDSVLRRVAQALRDNCGPTDIVGRYGGDEFLAILPGSTAEEAGDLALRLRDGMGVEGFRRAGDERTIPITLSFGVAAFPDDSRSRHELLTIADANLYRAKNSDAGITNTSQEQRTNRALRTDATFSIFDALVTAVDNKDRYTRRHSEDVAEYSLWIAEEMGLSEESLRLIRVGALLHDVGKIGVPDEVLRKPGRLTPEEYEVMQRHPRLGALLVGAVPGMEAILDIVRSHHERWDGQGYPDQLAGQAIPLLGRITAVADAVSAMTTARPYRKALDWSVALDQVRAGSGSQFDPAAARAFLRAAARRLASGEMPNAATTSPLLRAA